MNNGKDNLIQFAIVGFILLAIPYCILSRIIGFHMSANDGKILVTLLGGLVAGLLAACFYNIISNIKDHDNDGKIGKIIGISIRTLITLAVPYYLILHFFANIVTLGNAIAVLIISIPIAIIIGKVLYDDCY